VPVKVSIITTSFNSAKTLSHTLESVSMQTYPEIEHVLVDGASRDGSVKLIQAWSADHPVRWVSEKDSGIYDALNKGIKMATGDIIGLLHSDDFYFDPRLIERVARIFETTDVDAVYGDVEYVDPADPKKVTRLYSSARFQPSKIAYGWIPAHPSLFLRRRVYDRFGLFDSSFRIAGDFEFLSRVFWNSDLRWTYLPETLVRMREGGLSNQSFKNRWKTNLEILRACRKNKIPTNLFKLSLRYPLKLLEYAKTKRVA